MTLVSMIALVYSAQGQSLPDGVALQLDLKAWEFALEEIPTYRLEECFKRALRAKRTDYPLNSAAVNREWDGLKEELRLQASAHSEQQERLLMAGYGSLGLMTLVEWKARHNLPEQWKMGDPYPPESDLSWIAGPNKVSPLYRCDHCKDARWLVDRSEAGKPRLMLCFWCANWPIDEEGAIA